MKNPCKDEFETAKRTLTAYLESHHHRRTPERYAILREIYSFDGHFDIEYLFSRMKANKYRVSRATLYNTMDLLLECNLVSRIQLGENHAKYEKSCRFRQHDHYVDMESGQVKEFCDPRIHEIIKGVEDTFRVEIDHHSLILYGRKKTGHQQEEKSEL
jgi:Fur family ferric uptake transcriptional regulator